MSLTKDSVDLQWPAGSVRALVEYDRISAKITRATPGGTQGAVEARIESDGHCVVLERTLPCAGVINHKLEIAFRGIRFRRPRITFFDAPGCGVDSQAERRTWTYEARQQECRDRKDEVQDYFFELDSQTHTDYIDFVVADREEAENRKKAVGKVLEYCWRCIVGKYRDRTAEVDPDCFQTIPRESPWPDPNYDPREELKLLSRIFHAAASKLNGDQSRVRTALEEFAAGYHRLPLKVQGLSEDVIVTEPDSSNVFLFAEFAFLCIKAGIDVEKWKYLLPSLVKMQALFVFRVPNRCQAGMCVTDYNRTPDHKLSKDEWSRIEDIYASEFIDFDIVRLGSLMGVNLADLAACI